MSEYGCLETSDFSLVVKDTNISFFKKTIRPLKLKINITMGKRGHQIIRIQGQAKGQQQGRQSEVFLT